MERCGNKRHQTVSNMMSQYLELKLSQGQLYQITRLDFSYGPNISKLLEPLFALKYNARRDKIIF